MHWQGAVVTTFLYIHAILLSYLLFLDISSFPSHELDDELMVPSYSSHLSSWLFKQKEVAGL
jgi:hypothetical protein